MEYDAIIVLTHVLAPDGSLSPECMLRLQHAVSLYKKGVAPVILMTGGMPQGGSQHITEAAAFRDTAIALGVPSEATLLEEDSKDTVSEFLFSLYAFALPRGWKRLVIVTSVSQVERARVIAGIVIGDKAEVAFEASPTAIDARQHEMESLAMTLKTFEGVVPGSPEVLVRFFERHALYKNDAVLKKKYLSLT